MTAPHDPLESLADRARRALRDNDEARNQVQMIAAEVRAQSQQETTPFRPARSGESGNALAEDRMAEARRQAAEAGAMAQKPVRQSEPVLLIGRSQPERGEPTPVPIAPTWDKPAATPDVPVPDRAVAAAPEEPAPVWHREVPAPRLLPPEPQTAALVERRMQAIRLVRDLEPRRNCFRQHVQELQQRLTRTPTDSVHYVALLGRLSEAHAELSRLVAQMEEAQHVIRSTEWLMEVLTDPTRTWSRPAGEEMAAGAR
jgi:hypothetical protein